MILYRFMDDQELKRFLSGQIVLSNRSRIINGRPEDSFLFFDDSKSIESRIKYMVGKSDLSNVAEFEVLNFSRFIKTTGVYRSLGENASRLNILGIAEMFYLTVKEDYPTVTLIEYRTRMYSSADLKILRIGMPGMFTGIKEGEYMVKWEEVDKWKTKRENCLPQ